MRLNAHVLRVITLLLCLTSLPGHADSLLAALNYWVTGITTTNPLSNARFRGGVTADGGQSFGTGFSADQKLDVLADIRVAPEHVGRHGILYMVARANGNGYMKNSKNQWQDWDYQPASLVGNASLISKVYFPRLLIPAAAVVTAFADFLITLGLLALLMLWYGVAPGWSTLALPFFAALAAGLALGLGLLLAALNVQYRDFRYIVPFLIQVGLFVSPIAFTTALMPARWKPAFMLNPLVGIIDGFRWSILGEHFALDPGAVGISAALTGASLLVGVWYFRRVERSFADVI